MTNSKQILASLLLIFGFSLQAKSADLEKSLQPTVASAQKIAADPKIVKAVKEANTANAAKYKDMNQDKWKALSIMDPIVKDFTKNEAAVVLKADKPANVTEMFLNAKDGSKVAFLAKTSGWIHVGKPKHDVPMTGKVWIGKIETDESTGLQQVQIAVPVLEDGKVIGTMVVGVDTGKL